MPTYMKPLPSQEYLKEAFDYDPDTGLLTWKHRPFSHFNTYKGFATWNHRWPGTVVGNADHSGNRVRIKLNSTLYTAHRIIWKWMTGEDPMEEIDHRRSNGHNNSWENLREATRTQNAQNAALRSDSTTGFKGIFRRGDKYLAYIGKEGKWEYLGIYNTLNDALKVRDTVAVERHGEFFREG